ncbi:hypothetical protein BD779DRAFT_1676685 [Infundibulicybe gibba]|nr:hypothetical protein BD779DRAFT_1676685 [Infundibulicybe gibba]
MPGKINGCDGTDGWSKSDQVGEHHLKFVGTIKEIYHPSDSLHIHWPTVSREAASAVALMIHLISCEGEAKAMGPDGKLLDAAHISWFHDADDTTPMSNTIAPPSAPEGWGHRRKVTERLQASIEADKLDEDGKPIVRLKSRARPGALPPPSDRSSNRHATINIPASNSGTAERCNPMNDNGPNISEDGENAAPPRLRKKVRWIISTNYQLNMSRTGKEINPRLPVADIGRNPLGTDRTGDSPTQVNPMMTLGLGQAVLHPSNATPPLSPPTSPGLVLPEDPIDADGFLVDIDVQDVDAPSKSSREDRG